MVDNLIQHMHCQICGKAIPLSETLCSEKCKDKFNKMVKKRRMLIYFMYALVFFILALFFVQNMF